MKVVHLPCYDINPYQRLLIQALNRVDVDAVDGGGGGNFLRSILFRWRADVVHFHWLHPYLLRPTRLGTIIRAIRFLFELLILRAAGVRLVWTVHNLHNHEGKYLGIERFMTSCAAKLFHAIVCHSNYSAQQAADRFGIKCSKINVIPHPVFNELYSNTVSTNHARKILGLDLNDAVILFIGRVAPYKGIEKLIDTFLTINAPGSQLVIAGMPMSQEYQKKIETEVEGNSKIHLVLRRIEDDEMQVFLNAADVVAFPFRNILTSGSLLLAMGFGKACIAPRIGSIPETFPDLQLPLTYLPEDEQGLELAIREAFTQKDSLAGIGQENLKICSEWTWEMMAKQCLQTYGFGNAAVDNASSQSRVPLSDTSSETKITL